MEYNNRVGVFFVVFISVIVGLSLMGVIANNTNQVTSTAYLGNYTVTAGAVNASVNVIGQTALANIVITNRSDGAVISTTHISNDIVNGQAVVRMRLNDTLKAYAGQGVNVSYTYEPTGYLRDSGSRAVTSLILIFFCLAIAFVALYPTLKEKFGY